jgi:hypothetical protein
MNTSRREWLGKAYGALLLGGGIGGPKLRLGAARRGERARAAQRASCCSGNRCH